MSTAPAEMSAPSKLGFLALFGQGFGAMAPPYNGVLVGAVIVAFAGKSTPAVFLLAGVGIIFYATMIIYLARHVRSGGGLYSVVQQGIGPRAALWYAAALLANGVFSVPAAVISAANLLQLLLANALPGNAEVHWLAPALLLLCGAVGVTYRGAEISGRVIVAMLFAGMAAIVGLDVCILLARGWSQIAWSSFMVPPAGGAVHGVMMGVGVGVLTYAGSEGTVFLSGEAAHPQRDIPRAVVLSIVCSLLFYVFTALSFATALPGNEIVRTWANGGPLVLQTLSEQYISAWYGYVTLVLIALAAMAGVISFINYIARLMQALALEGYLPRRLALVNRHQAPQQAITVLAIASVMCFAAGVLVVDGGATASLTLYSWLYVGVTLFMLVSYLIVCVAAWRLAHRVRDAFWPRVVVPAVTFVLMLLAAVSQFTPAPPYPYNYAVWAALLLLLGAWLYIEWLFRKKALI